MCDTVNIADYIELNPHVPVIAEARLKGYGVAVWALIGHLPAVQGDLVALAGDYGVPPEAVEAAVAYYERYRVLIDARIAANRSDLDSILSTA